MKKASLCGLGQAAPNPVLSTLTHFRDEYDAHIREKRCPAEACTALVTYRSIPRSASAARLCGRNCPVQCITGEPKKSRT